MEGLEKPTPGQRENKEQIERKCEEDSSYIIESRRVLAAAARTAVGAAIEYFPAARTIDGGGHGMLGFNGLDARSLQKFYRTIDEAAGDTDAHHAHQAKTDERRVFGRPLAENRTASDYHETRSTSAEDEREKEQNDRRKHAHDLPG
jgi:hypothetical protein